MSIENRGIDNEFFSFLCKQWNKGPIHQTMEIGLVYLGQGAAGAKMSAGHEYSTVRGRLHGGIIATLADTAMGWAIITLGHTCVTVDMYMNYFTPAFEGSELLAEGSVIYSGKRTVVAEATLFNEKGELIAKSRGTFSLKKGDLREYAQSH